MKQTPFIIALDGPAASGKGTLGRAIADQLDLAYMDTGALYRCVALELHKNGESDSDEQAVLKATDWLLENFTPDLLKNEDLRSDEIGQMAARASLFPSMREKLLHLQRDFAAHPARYSAKNPLAGALLDGRDIGTVVCPQADIKLFVDADVEQRAERRLKELQSRGIQVTYSAVLDEMKARDHRDRSRPVAPLKPATDAIEIDTTHLGPDAALQEALELISKALGEDALQN